MWSLGRASPGAGRLDLDGVLPGERAREEKEEDDPASALPSDERSLEDILNDDQVLESPALTRTLLSLHVPALVQLWTIEPPAGATQQRKHKHPFIAAQLCASEEFHSALVAPKLLPLLWEGLNENSVLVGYFEQVIHALLTGSCRSHVMSGLRESPVVLQRLLTHLGWSGVSRILVASLSGEDGPAWDLETVVSALLDLLADAEQEVYDGAGEVLCHLAVTSRDAVLPHAVRVADALTGSPSQVAAAVKVLAPLCAEVVPAELADALARNLRGASELYLDAGARIGSAGIAIVVLVAQLLASEGARPAIAESGLVPCAFAAFFAHKWHNVLHNSVLRLFNALVEHDKAWAASVAAEANLVEIARRDLGEENFSHGYGGQLFRMAGFCYSPLAIPGSDSADFQLLLVNLRERFEGPLGGAPAERPLSESGPIRLPRSEPRLGSLMDVGRADPSRFDSTCRYDLDLELELEMDEVLATLGPTTPPATPPTPTPGVVSWGVGNWDEVKPQTSPDRNRREVDMLCLEIFGSDVGPLGSLDDSAGDALRFIPAGPLGGGFDEANRSDLATPSSFTLEMERSSLASAGEVSLGNEDLGDVLDGPSNDRISTDQISNGENDRCSPVSAPDVLPDRGSLETPDFGYCESVQDVAESPAASPVEDSGAWLDDVAPPDRPFDREVACSPDVGSVDDSFESASDESEDGRRSLAASPESQSVSDYGSRPASKPVSRNTSKDDPGNSTGSSFGGRRGPRDLGENIDNSRRRPHTGLSERPGSVASVESMPRPDTVGSLPFIDEVDQLAASVDSLRPESVESWVRPGSAESWEEASDSNAAVSEHGSQRDIGEDDENIGPAMNMDQPQYIAGKDDNFLANLDVGSDDGDEIEDGVRFFGIDDKNKEVSPVRRSASTPVLQSPNGPQSSLPPAKPVTGKSRKHGSNLPHIDDGHNFQRGAHRF
jgi:hypothetical protein